MNASTMTWALRLAAKQRYLARRRPEPRERPLLVYVGRDAYDSSWKACASNRPLPLLRAS
jgi:predicted RNA-binding protein